MEIWNFVGPKKWEPCIPINGNSIELLVYIYGRTIIEFKKKKWFLRI